MTNKKNRKRNKKERKNNNNSHGNHHAVLPAPMLFKRAVTLTDAIELNSSSVLGSGFGQIQISANGAKLPTSATFRVPQTQIWDRYAQMFDFYQVKRVSVRFIPYKWEYPGGVGAVQTTGYPTWSIIDPEPTLPSISLPGSYYSYGNCRDSKPYAEHHRAMNNFTDLGISKQSELIQPTGGAATSRTLYTDATQIGLLGRAPTQAASGAPIGLVVFTIAYEFSGQRAPNVSSPQPQAQIVDNLSESVMDNAI